MENNQLKIDLQEEIWLPVVGYEKHYEVSSIGNIRSIERYVECPNNTSVSKKKFHKSRIMRPFLAKNGYLRIHLIDTGKGRKYPVHRVVAQAFITSIEGKPQVNHINGIKTDNRVSNLEWCNQSENAIHALKTGLMSMKHMVRKTPIVYNSKMLININTGVFYDTEKDAAKSIPMSRQNLNDMMRGKNGRKNKSPFRYA